MATLGSGSPRCKMCTLVRPNKHPGASGQAAAPWLAGCIAPSLKVAREIESPVIGLKPKWLRRRQFLESQNRQQARPRRSPRVAPASRVSTINIFMLSLIIFSRLARSLDCCDRRSSACILSIPLFCDPTLFAIPSLICNDWDRLCIIHCCQTRKASLAGWRKAIKLTALGSNSILTPGRGQELELTGSLKGCLAALTDTGHLPVKHAAA